jgi:non-ribosomal peptide synthetase component E (peptide arylation enzyme)
MVNLTAFIRFHASTHPERSALVYEGRHISYGELHQRIQQPAAG